MIIYYLHQQTRDPIVGENRRLVSRPSLRVDRQKKKENRVNRTRRRRNGITGTSFLRHVIKNYLLPLIAIFSRQYYC